MCLSVPGRDIRVNLTLVTDLSGPPGPVSTKRNFSVTTEELDINDKVSDCEHPECCHLAFDLPVAVKNAILNSKNGTKLSKIGGKFTIELTFNNFEVALVSPKTLNRTILHDAESSDVVICTGDGKEIPCHRAFLTVNSVVLKTMLQSNFKESSGKIKMPDMSEEGVRAFLAFLYYRDLAAAKEKISIAWELLQAGEKYCVIPLRTSMEKIFWEIDEDSWWKVETALQIFVFIDKIDSELKEDVKEKIVKVMKRSYREWMSCGVYQKILKENPAIISELLKGVFSLCSCELPTDPESD